MPMLEEGSLLFMPVLLPIFWSTRTGVEIMQPLATPVVGGMISSLLHILIVTPVLFVMLNAPKKEKTRTMINGD